MGNCSVCGKYCEENDIFCLHCGALLIDYENIKLKNVDYSLEGDEFLENVSRQFSKTSERYYSIMDNFSKRMGESSIIMNEISENPNIEYHERILKYSNSFDRLSNLFNEVLHSLQEPTFSVLVFSTILWKKSLDSEELQIPVAKTQDDLISSLNNLVDAAEETQSNFEKITVPYPNETFDVSKNNLILRFDRFIVFHKSFIWELKLIKDKYLNYNHMTSEDNHNHFCIYCGARLEGNQNFCSQCGKPVYRQKEKINVQMASSKYMEKIDELEQEYNSKQSKARELVEKQFDPDHLAYDRFSSSIIKSNNLFDIQVGIARKMAEMDVDENPFVERELKEKISTLETFIDKMEDLTSELVIHLSSNKKDIEDINNLFNDMDDLIDSVKDY